MRKQILISTVSITNSLASQQVATPAPLLPVLRAFGLPADAGIIRYGSGLINDTWKVVTGSEAFILQRINDAVFRDPGAIAYNVRRISDYLAQHHPAYHFVTPLATTEGLDMAYLSGQGYYRLLPFVKGSHTADVATSAAQAYEAARQFGRFTRLLSGMPATSLKITLPDFHNLGLRFQQFDAAVTLGNTVRLKEESAGIGYLLQQRGILEEYQVLQQNVLHRRVTHHDTKISNVLFDEQGRGTHVIDLDTVMPGYFISDIGDMMRTYLSPASEEEADYSLISIRTDFFHALKQGYLSEMGTVLSREEQDLFVFAGKFMIYMQALRFMTDHLLNDVYYGVRYEGQNKVRASNQIALLKALFEKEEVLAQI